MRQPNLADTLDALARAGDRLFYEGEIGQSIIQLCSNQGGQLTDADLLGYRTHDALQVES